MSIVDVRQITHEGKPIGKIMFFWCPGCDDLHSARVEGDHAWQWNGSLDKPALSPSILVGTNDFKDKRCHSYMKDGQMQFLDDCYHELKGQTVPLPELPAWV